MQNITKKEGVNYVLRVIQDAEKHWPAKLRSKAATVLLLATSGQEANWQYQKQINGPARGLWQFEKAGGVYGVMTHPSTKDIAKDICQQLGVEFQRDAIYNALCDDKVSDILDASFARLLYFANANPLPPVGDPAAAWRYYIETWRPGRPRQEHWPRCYSTAMARVE